jgi:hypothetical protein
MFGGILKYDLLNSAEKKEVSDFIDFLVSKKKKTPKKGDAYRKQILKVSVWTEEGIKIFETNKAGFNEWKPQTW